MGYARGDHYHVSDNYGAGDQRGYQQPKGGNLPNVHETLVDTTNKPSELTFEDETFLQDLAAGKLPPTDISE